jgi:hypothetical protein
MDKAAGKFEELEARLRAAKADGEKLSEDDLALALIDRHGSDLQYDAEPGKWTRWSPRGWAFETTVALFDLARKICRNPPAAKDKKQ